MQLGNRDSGAARCRPRALRRLLVRNLRETYDGPLTLAEDNLVWNITKNDITVRSIVSPDDAWSVIGPNTPLKPDRAVPDQLSKWSLEHRWDISDVSAQMIEEFNKKYNLKPKPKAE